MKFASAILFVASNLCSVRAQSVPAPFVGVWREKNIDWINAPKDLGYKERAGNSGILRFSPDGSFTLIYTTIYQGDKHENPSQGDSWTIYFGKWKQEGNAVEVSYSMVYRDIRKVDKEGKEICPPSVETKRLTIHGPEIEFDNVTYVKDPRLEAGVDRTFHSPPGLPAFHCPRQDAGAP